MPGSQQVPELWQRLPPQVKQYTNPLEMFLTGASMIKMLLDVRKYFIAILQNAAGYDFQE